MCRGNGLFLADVLWVIFRPFSRFFGQMCCGEGPDNFGPVPLVYADICAVETAHLNTVTDVLWTNGHMYGGSWFRSLYGQMSCGHAPVHLLGHVSCGNGGTSWTHVRWVLVS